MKLIANYVRSYRNSEGNRRFVYMLNGAKNAVDQYLKDKEEEGYPSINPDTNEPEPILNSGRYIPNKSEVVRSDKGKWFPDTFELDALNDLKSQFPHLSEEALRRMIHAPSPVSNEEVDTPQDVDEDLDI